LPASVVVKLAPFDDGVLQHFIHLERPEGSGEPDGAGFAPELRYKRGVPKARITPMGMDYETVGAFYATLGADLQAFVSRIGEASAFCGDPALQLSPSETDLPGARPVVCSKTALAAFKAIVEQGEGAPEDAAGSHFRRYLAIRAEMTDMKAANPAFAPAHPVALNPVLRPPVRSGKRVWIENEDAAVTVDLANTSYALMLRLVAYSYAVPRSRPEKALAIDLAMGLMRTVTLLAERAARLPAGPSNPGCNAGMSFSALRDAAPLPSGPSAARFFVERLAELSAAATHLEKSRDARAAAGARQLADLAKRAAGGFEAAAATPSVAPQPAPAASLAAAAPQPTVVDGVEHIEGEKLTLVYDGKKCIHARFCVTGAPKVFLANVKGPWIHPDAMDVEGLVAIARLPVGRDPLSAQGREAGRGSAPRQPDRDSRDRTLRSARGYAPRWSRGKLSSDALPLRSLEEQALLRRVARQVRVRRHR
jgi:uncharacterized Fe-S cluster protein YjdI